MILTLVGSYHLIYLQCLLEAALVPSCLFYRMLVNSPFRSVQIPSKIRGRRTRGAAMAPGGRESKRKRSIVPAASTRVLWSSSSHQHPVPEQLSPTAENCSGGENVVHPELATVADNSSFHEVLNNPYGANGVNKTKTARNTDSMQIGSSSEGWLLCFT